MKIPEIDASDIKYIEAGQSEFSYCLVRMCNDAGNAYNYNYDEHSRNPRRSNSPCAGIECDNCMFSTYNSDLDTVRKFLSTFTNNVCYEDNLIIIL